MNIILVDDEWLALEQFVMETSDVEWIHIIGKFNSPINALEFIKHNKIDVAILDIEMPQINGIEFAHMIKSIDPSILVIFITGYDQYAMQAFKEQAFGYFLKPIERDEVIQLLEKAKVFSSHQSNKVRIKTFGRFDIFSDDGVVLFKNSKAKELLALCVDRKGGVVSMEEAIDTLWPDREYDSRVKNLYRKAILSLKTTLASAGIEYIFDSGRGFCYIKKALCTCDYFDYIEKGQGEFFYEYMFEYDWAERTNAILSEMEIHKANLE